MSAKLIQWASALAANLVLLLGLTGTACGLEPKTDFNGDGRADLLVRNLVGGELSAWLISASRVQRPPLGDVAPQSGWAPFDVKDLNGDGKSDLLWHNGNTGAVSVWLINGPTVTEKKTYGARLPANGWLPLGSGDVSGDGVPDLCWYNAKTGEIAAWFLNGTTIRNRRSYGSLNPHDGWTPLALSDATGDGRADVFWYNIVDGRTGIWALTASGVSRNRVHERPSGIGWVPAGFGDFNGDRRTDVLWFQGYSREIGAWLLGPELQILGVASYGILETGWNPLGFGDFNGDGTTDLFVHHGPNGTAGVWLFTAGGLLDSVSLGSLAPTSGWAPFGFDDFNGDGRTDVLWYNAFDNRTRSWLLNGGSILRSVAYGPIPASSLWQIQIPR